jgi:hypothetical protein
MNTFIKRASLCLAITLLYAAPSMAQSTDTSAEFKPSGKLWGNAFGDYAWKGGNDEKGRGGSNQYTKVPLNSNLFQFRRIYLGYDYNISKKFSAEFLLAAEDNWAGGVVPGTGDVLADNKFAPYIKLANIRWKKFWKNNDLVFGQSATPTFAKNGSGMASEEVWGYRSIERTITDIRRTSSFDFGLTLMGKIDKKENFGYVLMAANGTGAKAETDQYKMFYGDIWGKFLNKKLIIDFSQDYAKMHWGVFVPTDQKRWDHDRYMTKLFIAYTQPKFTVGLEVFMNTLSNDVVDSGLDGKAYYRTTKAMGVSLFTKGRITKETLGFFARFDNYDPSGNLSNIVGDVNTKKYAALTSTYEPTTKEMFATFGLDFTPIKNLHIMPNVWMNTYESALSSTGSNSKGTKYTSMNSNVSGIKGTDAVYRLTLYWVYGK